jgi:hypothetical protein
MQAKCRLKHFKGRRNGRVTWEPVDNIRPGEQSVKWTEKGPDIGDRGLCLGTMQILQT